MKNYSLGCAFNITELFENFNKKKLKMTSELCTKINNDPHKDKLIYKIFRESVKLILNDIIDNNVTFELPTGARKSDIYMRRISDEDFGKARRNGKWQDVDFLESNFSGYELSLNMYNREGKPTRSKTIYVDKKLKQKITDNTNKGKQYC